MILLTDDEIVIKLRLPYKKQRLSKKGWLPTCLSCIED